MNRLFGKFRRIVQRSNYYNILCASTIVGVANLTNIKYCESNLRTKSKMIVPFTSQKSQEIIHQSKPASYNGIAASIQKWNNIFTRFIFLMYCLTPAVTLAPFALLFPNSQFQSYWWEFFLSSLSKSGPCMTKFVQWAATRPDLFPIALCNRLKKLQHETNAHNQEEAIKMIKSKDWDVEIELTSAGTPNFIGSGCVAQVVKGNIRLSDSSVPVAIKVIQPSIKRTIQSDLDLLKFVGSTLEMIPGVNLFAISESIDEFAQLMTMQLDLRNEAANLLRFKENFSPKQSYIEKIKMFLLRIRDPSEFCSFPEPIQPFVTSDVLVETFEEGTIMSDILLMKNEALNRQLAKIGLHAILKMVFEDNFIHADLHPGNIIVKKCGDDYKLCMIDAGIVAELDDTDRKNFLDVFAGIVMNDGYRVGELFIERSKHTNDRVNKEGFAKDMSAIITEVNESGLALNRIGIGNLLQRVLVSCYVHHVKLEPKFSSILIAIGVLEGLGRRLDEKIDLLRSAIPYVLNAAIDQTSKATLLR